MGKMGKKGKAEKEEKANRVRAAESPLANKGGETEKPEVEVVDCKPKKIVCCRCGHFCKKEGHGFCPVKKTWRARKADPCESYYSTRS